MKLFRTEKGENNFILTDLTLAKLNIFKNLLEQKKVRTIVEEETYQMLIAELQKLDGQFGESHYKGKIKVGRRNI